MVLFLKFFYFILLLSLLKLNYEYFIVRSVNTLLRLSVFVSTFLWYLIPGLISLFFPDIITSYGISSSYDDISYYVISIVELLFLIVFLTLFLRYGLKTKLIYNHYFQNLKLNIQSFENNYKRLYIVSLILSLFIIYYNITFFSQNYSEFNFGLYLEDGLSQSTFDKIIIFFTNFSISYLILLFWFSKNFRFKFISIFSLLVYTYFKLMSGSSFWLFLPIFIFLKYLFFGGSINAFLFFKRNAIRIMIFAIFSFVALTVVKNIQDARNDEVSISNVSLEFDSDSKILLGTLFTKLNSFSSGYVLLKYDGFNFAGFKPYVGSFFIFIPRSIWPDRPPAGSFNDSYSGTPARRVPILLGFSSDFYNVGVSPLSVSIWQLGLLGVLFYLVLLFFYFKFLNNVLSDGSIFKTVVVLSFFSIPNFSSVFPYPDQIIKNFVVYFVIFLIKFIVDNLFKRK